MKRRLAALLLGAALLAAPAYAATVTLDGTPLELGAVPIYNDAAYVPLRALMETLYPQATVSWEEGRARVRGSGMDLTAVPGENALTYNGAQTQMALPVRLEEGRTLVPIRPLAALLGLEVDWEAESCTVLLTTPGQKAPVYEAPVYQAPVYQAPAYETPAPEETACFTPDPVETLPAASVPEEAPSAAATWSEDDLYWLSRIISAESQGECWEGKIAVGNVVLNRVSSDEFPNTIYDVIFDMRWGGQFAPVRNGTIYNDPTEESVQAALAVLQGENTVGDSLYFIAPSLTSNHWTMNNRDYVTTIGVHWFYK